MWRPASQKRDKNRAKEKWLVGDLAFVFGGWQESCFGTSSSAGRSTFSNSCTGCMSFPNDI